MTYLKTTPYFIFTGVLLFSGCSQDQQTDKQNLENSGSVNHHRVYVPENERVMTNVRLLSTNSVTTRLNKTLYGKLEEQMKGYPDTLKEKIRKYKAIAIDSHHYIDSLYKTLVSVSEGVSLAVADTLFLYRMKTLDSVAFPQMFMLGPNPRDITGNAVNLKAKLFLLDAFSIKLTGSKAFQYSLYTGTSWNSLMNLNVSWEWTYFFKKPLASVLNELAFLNLQISINESQVIAFMMTPTEAKKKKG